MSNLHQNGHPLRHDGTPFPDDQSQWTEAESQYLQSSWFAANDPSAEEEAGHATIVAPVERPNDGSAIA